MDNDGVEDAYDTDIDGDGIPNDVEISNSSNPRFFIDKQPPNSISGTVLLSNCGNSPAQSILGHFTSDDPDFNSSLTLSITPNYPEDLNPSIWLDADDHESIIKKSGRVEQWRDKSGNANHFSQNMYKQQTAYGSRTQNNRQVVDFTAEVISCDRIRLRQVPISVSSRWLRSMVSIITMMHSSVSEILPQVSLLIRVGDLSLGCDFL